MKNFTNNFKQFTSRLSARWLIMALMMLVGTSSAWAWGGAYRDVTNQPDESPIFYLGDKITFYWILDGIGSGATCKKVYISTSSSNKTEDWKYDLTWVKKDNDDKQYWKSSQITASAIDTWYYSLWLGWGSGVGDNGRYYNGSQTSKTEGNANFIKSSFSIKALPTPTNAKVTISGTTASLSWTKNATYTTVMIVRYAKGATVTDPTQGTAYTAGTSKLGTGTVIYKGTAGSTTNTVVAGSSYDYYFYTVNNNYYSSSVKVTADGYTYPAVSTISATVDGDNLVCEGKITSMGSASTVVWAFTVLSTDNISKATTDWKYPDGQNKITAANTSFTYNIPISSLSLTEGNTYYVRAMAVDLDKPGISNNQYGNAVAGDAISFKYDPCTPPAAPTFDEILAQCGSYTLPIEDKYKVSVKWYDAKTEGNEITSVNTSGIYYAEAVDGTCVSENRTDVEITINPKPSIGDIIQSVTKPVPFEDVVLTADGVTPGAQVKWYVEENLVAENTNTYTVTSDEAEEVIVTAKAFLGNCESDFKEHKVTFSAENCNSTTTTEQQTVGKTKIIVDNPQNWSTMKCYAWRTSDNKEILGVWSGTEMTKNGNNYEILIDFAEKGISESDKIKVIFNVGSSQTVDSEEVFCNKIYRFSIDSDKDNNKYKFSSQTSDNDPYTEPVEVTVGPEITAPAVKMVSAEYNETTDKIDVVAAVYKRGCDDVEWGFQYSEDGITWSDKIHPNSHTATAVGEVTHSFSIDGGDGNTYYIRAYAKNSNSEVTSANTKSVEIPSKTIESATILLVEGEESDVTEVCPQSTVYLKVSYVGGDFKDYEAADDFPGTNLELVNHDKAKNEAIFSYTATAAGVANITISNDNTSITTTNGVSITLKNVTPVNAPMISISQGTICEDGSATITVNNPIANLTYTLYKETEPIGNLVNYQTGDLTEAGSYTVRAEESICHNYANSMPVELKVVTSDVKIGLAVDKTTVNPWQPLKLTVTPPEGYAYTIDGLADVVYTQSGDVYTIKIPRPNDWSPGNSGDPLKTMPITFSAKIQVTDDLTCGTSSVNVTLADTEENCK